MAFEKRLTQYGFNFRKQFRGSWLGNTDALGRAM